MTNKKTSAFAANESNYWPCEFADPAFTQWMLRIGMKLVNLPLGRPDDFMHRVLVSEGVPSPAWALALAFMLRIGRDQHKPN